MKLTLMKRERMMALIKLGDEISILSYDSLVIYQREIVENLVIERLFVGEKIQIA